MICDPLSSQSEKDLPRSAHSDTSPKFREFQMTAIRQVPHLIRKLQCCLQPGYQRLPCPSKLMITRSNTCKILAAIISVLVGLQFSAAQRSEERRVGKE